MNQEMNQDMNQNMNDMTAMCGVILAAGAGSRLGYPNELGGKPMVKANGRPLLDYNLCRMAKMGVRDVALVVNPVNRPVIEGFAGDGAAWGLNLTYVVQEVPLGIAHALSLCRDFAAGRYVALLLVDNLFSADISGHAAEYVARGDGKAQIFVLPVKNPQDYGVAEFDGDKLIGLVEKPQQPVSDLAVIGVYFYPPDAFDLIPNLRPSARGELEITDLNSLYLQAGRLECVRLGGRWLDVGNPEKLAEAERMLKEQE